MIHVLAPLGIGALLAYANGANDVSKSIATLVGSGVSQYSRAVLWGALWACAGAALASAAGGAMLATFGAGLLKSPATLPAAAALAILIGASAWVALATRTGLPVSTTHALVGSLVGVIWWVQGAGAIRWAGLGDKVLLPLLLSPLAALVLTAVFVRLLRPNPQVEAADCLCVETRPSALAPANAGIALSATGAQMTIARASTTACSPAQSGVLRVTLDKLHWLTSGATAFARGLNDAPKLAALIGATLYLFGDARSEATPLWLIFAVVAVGMIVGSLVAGWRVTEVLATKVTKINHQDGFVANGIAAALVTAGAVYGLPMSTTHVTSGAIFGAGALRGTLNTRLLREILLAWIVTLPGAGLLGMGAFGLLRRVVS